MSWAIFNKAHWFPVISKNKAIRQGSNPDKTEKYKINAGKYFDNNNDESSESFEMENLAQVTLDKEVMVPNGLRRTEQSQKII